MESEIPLWEFLIISHKRELVSYKRRGFTFSIDRVQRVTISGS